MLPKRSIYLLLVSLICISTINTQQLQWILLSDGTSMDTPMERRDAALGFDQTFLILFGGRSRNGMPLQDSSAFNIQTGQWDKLTFPSPPSSRYGMGAASSLNGGLYIFGGFGTQGSSQNLNPYMSYALNQETINYNYATPPNFMQNPALMNNPDFVNNPHYNPMSGTGYNNNNNNNNNYNDNDDRADENYYPLLDAWFLSYGTKTWQQTQTSQYARAFGSAAASPYTSGTPKVLYSMGKTHNSMYSTVEIIGQSASGLSQTSATQSAIIMYDLSSYSPAYPHARYGHSTTLLTDNYLLLFGGCLSGYGKGGPCPSKDSWLLTIDSGKWERLGECPPTKTGASMVTVPPYSACGASSQGSYGASASINGGADQPVAILWGGREFNPSSIRTYPSPRDEVAVFSLSQKNWYLKRAAPSPNDGSYPMQREGAAFVAGCFQGTPGMYIFGGRSTVDRRLLSDLWFLQVSPQNVLSSPTSRGCIYPFSFYHLHGIFQFFTYGVIFPIGYFVGRHARDSRVKRPLHMILQISGVALAICGFSFGVHSVRAPSWLHFRHAHAIIGIITFILTIFQFIVGLIGAIFVKRHLNNGERFDGSDHKISHERFSNDTWAGEGAWRLIHRILGSIVIILGLINISLGVFLAVLPTAVWIIWYIYFVILIITLIVLEIMAYLRQGVIGKGGSHKLAEKREDPKGTSQSSLKSPDETIQQKSTVVTPRRTDGRVPPSEPSTRDNNLHRRGNGSSIGGDSAPLISDQTDQRQPRPGDVNASTSLPQYHRPTGREYPVPPRKKSGPGENNDVGYYAGYSAEPEPPLPRSASQQQGEHNITRVRLQ